MQILRFGRLINPIAKFCLLFSFIVDPLIRATQKLGNFENAMNPSLQRFRGFRKAVQDGTSKFRSHTEHLQEILLKALAYSSQLLSRARAIVPQKVT